MGHKVSSLLTGRNVRPLTQDEIRRAINTFLGLDKAVNVIHDQSSPTLFRVVVDELGNHYGEIVFGPDIYPGPNVVNPNSALSLDAAAAHELTHYHRWKDKTALPGGPLDHVDEALTSLQAIFRYGRQLNDTDMRLLIEDAIQRLQLFVHEQSQANDKSS